MVGVALITGVGIGWFYFHLLWVTVQKLMASVSTARAVAVLVFGYFVRLTVTLAVFYWLARLSIIALIVGVLGFTFVALLQAAMRARSGA